MTNSKPRIIGGFITLTLSILALAIFLLIDYAFSDNQGFRMEEYSDFLNPEDLTLISTYFIFSFLIGFYITRQIGKETHTIASWSIMASLIMTALPYVFSIVLLVLKNETSDLPYIIELYPVFIIIFIYHLLIWFIGIFIIQKKIVGLRGIG